MSAATIWFILGVIFILGELFSPVFVLLFFGLGAWAAGFAASLGVSLVFALTVFILTSVASLLLLRRVLVRTFKGRSRSASSPGEDSSQSGTPEHMLEGKLGTVSQAITPQDVGEVSVGGSYWRAVADQAIPEGATVRILGHEQGNELLLRVTLHLPE